MATIFAPPTSVGPPPEPDYKDLAATLQREQEWIAKIQAAARATHKGDIVGEIVCFPIADGAAQYVVWNTKPCELIHIPVGDAWNIPAAHARGIRTSDLRGMVSRNKSITALFKGP